MVKVKKELVSGVKNGKNVVRESRNRRTGVDSNSNSNSNVNANDSAENHNNEQRNQRQKQQKEEKVRRVNEEQQNANNNNNNNNVVDDDDEDDGDEVVVRRRLRSRYLAVKNLLSGQEEDSDRFNRVFNEVQNLSKKVRKPREQVADAEALLDITSIFVKSVKAQRNEGVTPSDFVSGLIKNFGQQARATSIEDDSRNSILWKDIGLAVSHIFRKGTGCCTMLGPMSSEIKKRKTIIRKRHVKPTEFSRPEELDNTKEEKTDTDKNMSTMFGILRKHRRVRAESLILNRKSFAQTVENLFALSFLVKDGRAEITANENGHFVCPRNAPAAEAIASGKVSYSHFVFRFDFKDWKLMLDSVGEGEELMPHRVPANTSVQSEFPVGSGNVNPEPSENVNPELSTATTPIRKLSRNRGLVLQEQTVVEESPEYDDNKSRADYIRRGKRRIL